MTQISLHILDLAQNCIRAEATLVEISVTISIKNDLLSFSITDNGKGMSADFLSTVVDPFATTRTTRRVGLGIPLIKMAAEQADGEFDISSDLGVGTTVRASFRYSHIDRQPLGDLASSIAVLISANPSFDFIFSYTLDDSHFTVDTRELRVILGDEVGFDNVDVQHWLLGYLSENVPTID